MAVIFKNIINYFKAKEPDPVESVDGGEMIYRAYDHHYGRDNVFTVEFYSNLIKAINWTEVLRSTNPIYEGKPFYHFGNASPYAATPDIPFNYEAILNHVLDLRLESDLLISNAHLSGQVLQFEIDLTTHDGAPCAESEGFVDESDIPPIDTWFYLTHHYLYCWIPNLFIEKMQGAMDVEMLDSYQWIKDAHWDLHTQIIKTIRMASLSYRYKSRTRNS